MSTPASRRSRGDGEHFLFRFAEAEHERRFGQHVVVPLVGGPAQDVERAFVLRDGTHGRIEPRHGLDVVREDFGRRGDDGAEGVAIAFEIGDQHLDRGAGLFANGADRLREMFGAAVGHVVAIDHRDDRVLHAHLRHGLGHAPRLVGIGGERLPFADRAEGAAARADLAEDHEGGGAGAPAFENVRAARFLADGVERQIVHQLRDGKLREIARHADLQPRGTMAGAAVDGRWSVAVMTWLPVAGCQVVSCFGRPGNLATRQPRFHFLQRLAVVGPADLFIGLGECEPAVLRRARPRPCASAFRAGLRRRSRSRWR